MDIDRLPRIAALLWAAAFLLATILGFIPNPLVGDGALFHANIWHNIVHLATALAFVVVATLGNRPAELFMKGFGVVYALVGAFGFTVTGWSGTGRLLGLVHINAADNLLHLGLGAAIGATGYLLSRASNSPTLQRAGA